MSDKKEDEEMLAKETKEVTVVSNETALQIAKLGMKKYRKTLDKLAKN